MIWPTYSSWEWCYLINCFWPYRECLCLIIIYFIIFVFKWLLENVSRKVQNHNFMFTTNWFFLCVFSLCRPRYSEDFRSIVPSVCWLFMPSTLSSPFLSFPLWLHHSTLSQVLALCSVHLVKTDAQFSFFLSFLTIIMFPWCYIWLSLPGLLLVKN